MGNTLEQPQFEIVPNVPAPQRNTHVYDFKRYILSEKYGTLLGTVIYHKAQYLAFCPMEISIHVLCFNSEYSLKNNCGKFLLDFYMDNDEVVDKTIYSRFINDKLSKEELGNIYIKKIIPYMEKEGKLK